MKFDSKGEALEWWTNRTKHAFHRRKQCFVDQYSKITDANTRKKASAIFCRALCALLQSDISFPYDVVTLQEVLP